MKFNNWVPEPDKCLSEKEVTKLLDTAKTMAQSKAGKLAVRNYFLVHLALATGLRVMEIAALNCGDLFLKNKIPSLLVRNGKGGKKRIVFFNTTFKKHCMEFFKWKSFIGEPIDNDNPLFLSSNTGKHMTRRAIQKVFKSCIQTAGLDEKYSIHCLRHTYACFLLKASNWNMRLVQKQLGHSRISTTQVYADVMMPDISNALERLRV